MLEKWYKKKLNPDKKDLIDFAFKGHSKQSFIDLGGVWGVEAGYTFYTLDKYDVKSAFLVDAEYTDQVVAKVKKYPQLRTIKGDFGQSSILNQLEKVDVVFMFERARDFVYVKDVVDAIMRGLETKRLKGDVLNVCSGKPTSINELVKI